MINKTLIPQSNFARLIEVEDGHGYFGVLSSTIDREKVQCHICGELFVDLAPHIPTHGVTTRDYKEMFGFPKKTGLLSERRKERLRTPNEGGAERIARVKPHLFRKDMTVRKKSALQDEFDGTTPEDTIESIRSLAKDGYGPSVAELRVAFEGTGKPGYSAAVRHFGSWTKALQAAGLKQRRRREYMSDEELLNRLKEMYEANPRLTARDIKNPSYTTYKKRFGGIDEALARAGIKREPYHKGATRESAIADIKKFYETYRKTPRKIDLDSSPDLPSYEQILRLFGGLPVALREAGIASHYGYRKANSVTREQLVQALVDLATEIGHTPTREEFQASHAYDRSGINISRVRYLFGGYGEFLEAAGLSPKDRPVTPRVKYTKEDVIKRLKDYKEEHGRLPAASHPHIYGLPAESVFIRLFGSIKAGYRMIDETDV